MKKQFVLKNSENNKYFTGRYENYWSLNLIDAEYFGSEDEINAKFLVLSAQDEFEIFEDITFLIVETIFFNQNKF